MKKNILFILHFSPPVHGSSVVGEQIRNSRLIKELFNRRFINLNTSSKINQIGKFNINKIISYINILKNVLLNLLIYKPKISYIAITAKGLAFYKDAIIVLILKLFGVKTIFHMHNKGVSSNQEKFIDNILYKLVFNNTEVIILSKYLYPDIKKYVTKDKLHICFNGIENSKSQIIRKKNKIVEILFLSNLIESKGVYILLEACKILKNNKIDFNCTFVGGEGDITEDQFNLKVNHSQLQNYVKYVGKKYGLEKEDFFAKLIFLLFQLIIIMNVCL